VIYFYDMAYYALRFDASALQIINLAGSFVLCGAPVMFDLACLLFYCYVA
jgi:hypothetical protein